MMMLRYAEFLCSEFWAITKWTKAPSWLRSQRAHRGKNKLGNPVVDDIELVMNSWYWMTWYVLIYFCMDFLMEWIEWKAQYVHLKSTYVHIYPHNNNLHKIQLDPSGHILISVSMGHALHWHALTMTMTKSPFSTGCDSPWSRCQL